MSAVPPAWWPSEASSCFADLVTYRLVGASACADRITAALVSVAAESQAQQRDISGDLAEAGQLFCDLKPDTALYRNLAASLRQAGRNGGAAQVRQAAQDLTDYRRAAQAGVVDHTEAFLEDADTLLVHDYSSMVLRILDGLGTKRPRRVVVTAGEPLGQGMRVARMAAAAGHQITYTPDMSVARVIDGIDGFITGVESFYADGSLANTVGTRMLGLLCREAGVPVIAPAEALKYDADRDTVTEAALNARLLHPWPNTEAVPNSDWTTVQFVLDAVPSSLITMYATEKGICRPNEVGATARLVLMHHSS
jgi:ribose 1,5-bisphosphate isomerase